MSPSNSDLLLLNFAKASFIFAVPLAASDIAVKVFVAAPSFKLLSSSSNVAFSSNVKF